jgi:hypothetical protein
VPTRDTSLADRTEENGYTIIPPGDEPEAMSVLAASMASRSEQDRSFATVSELVKTGIIAACAGRTAVITPRMPNSWVRIAAHRLIQNNDLVFNVRHAPLDL